MKRSILTVLLLVVVLAAGFVAGKATAAQPHMRSALDHLRAAKVELEKAEADKGGHREKAIALVADAIVQVEEGMDVGAHR
jgi:hypothetical protein